jgi:hypothetical protein
MVHIYDLTFLFVTNVETYPGGVTWCFTESFRLPALHTNIRLGLNFIKRFTAVIYEFS